MEIHMETDSDTVVSLKYCVKSIIIILQLQLFYMSKSTVTIVKLTIY